MGQPFSCPDPWGNWATFVNFMNSHPDFNAIEPRARLYLCPPLRPIDTLPKGKNSFGHFLAFLALKFYFQPILGENQ